MKRHADVQCCATCACNSTVVYCNQTNPQIMRVILHINTKVMDHTCLILQRSSIAFPHRNVTDVTLFYGCDRGNPLDAYKYIISNSIMALMHLYNNKQ